MIQITEDLVLGARFTLDHSGGSLLRLFEVTGLTPGRDTLAQAAAAFDGSSGSAIPRYGDPHPAVPGLFVAEIDAEPSRRFRRTVNASPWQGGDAKTWLCRAIDGNSLGNLSRYEVKYVFEFDPDGWERLEYYVDPYTAKIPDDVQTSSNNDKGIAKVLPYALSDFNQLGLPNAF